MKSFTTAIAAALLAAACGADQAAFEPVENVRATSPGGHPAAVYNVRSGSATIATVVVWSRGAFEADGRTNIEVVAEVRNRGDRPVRLVRDQVQLAAFGRDGAPLHTPQLVAINRSPAGSLAVQPGQAASFHLRFALPARVDPDRVGALRLGWAVDREDGQRYVQFTDFRQVREPTYVASSAFYFHDPVFGFYDPYFYGPPWGYHAQYYVPIGRVIVVDRDRPRQPRGGRRR